MSRHLPPHPNLEYLKKQAKDLLREMQQQDPALKLADAQHAIAREYGFSSWPKLKAHVESLSRPATPNAAPEKTNPFVGTWTANLSKSRRHPNNPFQSATIHFNVVGDTVMITDVVVDASGHEEHGKNTVQADGMEHPSEHGNGYILLARWLGSHVLEAVAKKDGQVVGRGTYEVSADGTILTISADDQVIVCDRQ
jgi:glyoxalase superfamily protein